MDPGACSLGVVGDDPSRGVLQTFLSLYLEPDGSVSREPGGLQPPYAFLCEVAAMGTRKAAGRRLGTVRCLSFTASGGCGTPVEVVMQERPRRLVWWCPKCEASGPIRGFEGTWWYRSKPVKKSKTTAARKTRKKGAQGTAVRADAGASAPARVAGRRFRSVGRGIRRPRYASMREVWASLSTTACTSKYSTWGTAPYTVRSRSRHVSL